MLMHEAVLGQRDFNRCSAMLLIRQQSSHVLDGVLLNCQAITQAYNPIFQLVDFSGQVVHFF